VATLRLSTAARNVVLQGLLDRLDSGSGPGRVRFYTEPMPQGPDTPILGQTLLATLSLSSPPAPPPANGVAVFGPVEEMTAISTGIAVWARFENGDGEAVFDVDVRSDGQGVINLNRLDFSFGGPVRLNGFQLSQPESVSF
jgi:hypothetical protein